MSMGKREKPQSVSWESQPSPPPSHLSIVIAHFFYRCTAVRVNLSSSVPSAIANHTTMNYDRSGGGSSDQTAPPRSAGFGHTVGPLPPSTAFLGHLDAEASPAD